LFLIWVYVLSSSQAHYKTEISGGGKYAFLAAIRFYGNIVVELSHDPCLSTPFLMISPCTQGYKVNRFAAKANFFCCKAQKLTILVYVMTLYLI
jgi:hypothetical protein